MTRQEDDGEGGGDGDAASQQMRMPVLLHFYLARYYICNASIARGIVS